MSEKVRLGISKWRDVIILFSVFMGLLTTLAISNRTFGEITTANVYLTEGYKTNKSNIEKTQTALSDQAVINEKVIANLDKLEKRQVDAEERNKQYQLNNDIEIVRLLKKNNLVPYKWRDIDMLPLDRKTMK